MTDDEREQVVLTLWSTHSDAQVGQFFNPPVSKFTVEKIRTKLGLNRLKIRPKSWNNRSKQHIS